MLTLKTRQKRIISLIATVALIVAMFSAFSFDAHAASVNTATGLINAKSGAILRKSTSTSSSKIALLKNNSSLKIEYEVFKSKTSTSKKNKWFKVTASGKSGYIRSDLVDTIKYSPVSGKTTDALNYRAGAGTKMKKKGTFSKGTTISVVLKAKANGSSTIWYKIKKGSNYYYVSSDYVKLGSTSTPAPAPVASAPAAPTFTLSGVSYPAVIDAGSTFVLTGKVSSNSTIQKVQIGIMTSAGAWKTSVTKTVNAKSFDISTVDASIKFGSLPTGQYIYRANFYVNGVAYTKINYSFKVANLAGPSVLATSAMRLAFPVGTAASQYDYLHEKGDKITEYDADRPTTAMKNVLDQYYPEHWTKWGSEKYGYGTRTGASCDVFIGTVVRASGYASDFPRAFDKLKDYFAKSDRFQKISYSYKESQLKSGDTIFYTKTNGGVHVCMYVVTGGKGYLAEAGLNNYYGRMNSSLSKVTTSSDKSWLYVYRASK